MRACVRVFVRYACVYAQVYTCLVSVTLAQDALVLPVVVTYVHACACVCEVYVHTKTCLFQ